MPSGEQEQQSGKLRLIMLACSAGLLLSALAASAGALAVLRELHTQEENVRGALAARSASILLVSSSTQIFNEVVQHHVLRHTPGGGDRDRAEVDRLAAEISSALRSYPADTSMEEQSALETIQKLVARQQDVFRSASSLAPNAGGRRGVLVVIKEMAPLRFQILASSEKLQVSNRAILDDARKTALAKFGDLRRQLKRFLAVALGSGLLLTLASTVYIARLERQAQLRYLDLVHSRNELQRLSARLVDAQESERRSISRELHDEVGQSLGALLVDMGRLASRLPRESGALKEELDRMKGVAEHTVRAVRHLALLLRPTMLDDLGLAAALEWQAREVSRRSEMEVEVHTENVGEDLPDEHKICIYRLVQEALNNAARHANARNALVSVERIADRIAISIRDDGCGFAPERSRGMGILGMEERLKSLGGSLSIHSKPGQGTIVRGDLPLEPGRHRT